MSKVWDVDTLGEFRREDQGDGTVAIWLVGFVFVAPNGITATVSTTGSATENSETSMWRSWENIIVPTITSAAAATSLGTMEASGETNIAIRNSAPVTIAPPVRKVM